MQAASFARGVNFTRDLIVTLDGGPIVPNALKSVAEEFRNEADSISWLARYVLGRLPKAEDRLLQKVAAAAPKDRIAILFRSAEYARPLGRRILTAFPANRRTHFLHVPKTGGSTANAAMGRSGRFVLAPSRAVMFQDRSRDNVHRYVRAASRGLKACADAQFYLIGHPNVGELIDQNLVRAGDTVFSIVRGSDDLFESFFNYILDMFERHRDGKVPFAGMAAWYRVMGLSEGEHPSTEQLFGMLDKILSRIIVASPICAALGSGTASSVLEAMRRVDGRLFPLRHLDSALRYIGVEAGEPENTSRRRYKIADFDPATQRKIADLMSEDAKLMDILESCDLHPEHKYYLLEQAKAG